MPMELLDTDTPDGTAIALHARPVKFDLSAVPAHYVYGYPVATHLYNGLSLLLPAGEEWFITVLKEALPHIEDEKLREDVIDPETMTLFVRAFGYNTAGAWLATHPLLYFEALRRCRESA